MSLLVKTPYTIGFMSHFTIEHDREDMCYVAVNYLNGSKFGVKHFQKPDDAVSYLDELYLQLRNLQPTIIFEECVLL